MFPVCFRDSPSSAVGGTLRQLDHENTPDSSSAVCSGITVLRNSLAVAPARSANSCRRYQLQWPECGLELDRCKTFSEAQAVAMVDPAPVSVSEARVRFSELLDDAGETEVFVQYLDQISYW